MSQKVGIEPMAELWPGWELSKQWLSNRDEERLSAQLLIHEQKKGGNGGPLCSKRSPKSLLMIEVEASLSFTSITSGRELSGSKTSGRRESRLRNRGRLWKRERTLSSIPTKLHKVVDVWHGLAVMNSRSWLTSMKVTDIMNPFFKRCYILALQFEEILN